MNKDLPSVEEMSKSIMASFDKGFEESRHEINKELFYQEYMLDPTGLNNSDQQDSDQHEQINVDDPNIDPTKRNYQEDDWFQVLSSRIFQTNNRNPLETLKGFDTIITYGWTGINYGPVSAWYDAFELWFIIQYNNLPSDLGGKKTALLFPDCPDTKSKEQILKSIFYKYDITDKTFISLCKSIFFIDQPKELILSKGEVPYRLYSPSNLVFVDGVLPKVPLQADNLVIQTHGAITEESLKNKTYNFLLVYLDQRIYKLNKINKEKDKNLTRDLTIAREDYTTTLIFDDIRRVNFNSFRTYPIREEIPNNKKRFLLYITPKNRSIYKIFQNELNDSTWSIQELDDILDTIPDSCLNNLGLMVKTKQKETYQYIKETNKRNLQKKMTQDQIELILNKKLIHSNGYTTSDVIMEDPKAHFILVGLNDDNRGFGEALLARALNRGINISTTCYTQKDLPIKDIHQEYDVYIFTPPNRWTTTRFLPEALYYHKKVILTNKAKDTMKWNIPMNLRWHDVSTHLMSVAEDDIFKHPKSKIANHLLNRW